MARIQSNKSLTRHPKTLGHYSYPIEENCGLGFFFLKRLLSLKQQTVQENNIDLLKKKQKMDRTKGKRTLKQIYIGSGLGLLDSSFLRHTLLLKTSSGIHSSKMSNITY
eukprot:TRINITY_DN22773_c0_g1_i1.p1 TRINITY_DN22773_c0_g1~~TRINITY_DN22773_c0_g1_i1.p1  ORF type:complete len:109 (+),score=11.62 TRINITY_DN22773_c0_g1_i1:1619-1945(+)